MSVALISSLDYIKITPRWKVATPLPVEDKSKCLLDVIIDCQFWTRGHALASKCKMFMKKMIASVNNQHKSVSVL